MEKSLKDLISSRILVSYYDLAVALGLNPNKARNLTVDPFMGYYVAYRDNTSDVDVLAYSFENDIFLPSVPNYKPDKSHVVLEVGGYIGEFALMLSSQVNRIYAVEARRETFAILKTNIAINGVNNIIADHAAISNQNGFVTLYHAMDGKYWGDSVTHNFKSDSEIVPSFTLERYFYERNISYVDFAKFNCQGSEYNILMSSEDSTLQKMKTMLISYHSDMFPEFKEAELLKKLNDAGFTTEVKQHSASGAWIIAEQN